MGLAFAQSAQRQSAVAEPASRAVPASAPKLPEKDASSGERPVPLTTRDRLEAALAPAEAEPVEQVEPEVEPEPAVGAAEVAPAEAPVTTRERIVLHALEAVAEAHDAAPVPVSRPVEPAPPPELELAPELEAEEAVGLALVPDADRQLAGARATLEPAEVEADEEEAPPAATPDTVARPHLTLVPAPDTRETDAPARIVEAVARGPPAAELATPHIVQTKLSVSRPGDPLEREADGVALRVLRGGAPAGRLPCGLPPARGPPPVADRTLPRSVASVVVAPGGGSALDDDLRARIEPHLGLDLGHVRVRRGPDAAAAARDLGARAFTSGSTIFLAAESSPGDLGLMAHEATHVAQQQTVAAARTTLMRDVSDYLPDVSVSDVIPDWILDGVRSAIRAIPGYTLLTYITQRDPLTDEPVSVSQADVIEKLLTWGPFGAAVGPILQTIDVLGDVFGFVSESLEAHDLTFARIKRDVDAAWDELSVTNGISGNVAIVERYVTAFLRDVSDFVDSIVDRVLEMVRAVVAEVAEPLLETPAIAPVWNLTKKVLHYDPLRGVDVEAPTAEIIGDFLRLIGQEQRLAQMEERGTLQETADWLDTQLATFASLVTELGTIFSDAWEAIQPQNLPDLLTNLEALAQRVFDFVQGVAEFAATVILKILEIIKDALLGWLSENAHRVPGFHLLTVILEQNPFTGEEVPRTAENLIKGFITLMPGGEATYDQLAESGVISDAADRIEGEMTRLGISLELITGIFLGIWDTLTLDDLLDPLGAFGRILDLFGEPLSRLIRFIVVVIEVVITLVLRLMNFPSDLLGSIVSNAIAAIEDIKRDPIAFVKNMLEAVKLGFTGFFANILTYLTQGLTAWLFRGLGQLGITIPTDFSLMSILTLVLQVLGITAEHLWTKLGEHIGPERVAMIRGAIDHLTGAWEFIKDVQENGISAVWRFVTDQLSGLWDTLLGMAQEWIMTTIITRVTAKLLTMLDPTGIMAVVNSFIAFFNAVQSAIEYLRDILEIVNRYVSTLAAVAAGNVVPGAQMIEQGLASVIPVAIGFLANQVGLGNVPEKIVEIIGRLRELVDRALDWLIAGAIRLGQAALNALGLGPASGATAGGPNEVFFEADAERHRLYREGPDFARAPAMVNPAPAKPVQTVLNEMEPRILTDLPIAEDRRTAGQALEQARQVLQGLAQPPPAGKALPELEPHLRTLYGLLGHPDVPPSVVSGHMDPMGRHVTGQPLTRKAGNTQGASSTSNAHIDQKNDITRLNSAAGLSAKGNPSIDWAAAHLLSARLHGPNAAGNFTPVSQFDNGAIRRKVEEPAIALLAADEGTNMLWWDAAVSPRPESVLAHWAESLVIRFGRWDATKADGHGAEIDSITVRPQPDFTGTRSIGSLSEDGPERLSSLTGMNFSVARMIGEVRERRLGAGGRFRNWEHVVDLVMSTPTTAGGLRTSTSAETALAELDRLHGRLVPYFGFDPDAEILRFLEVMRHLGS